MSQSQKMPQRREDRFQDMTSSFSLSALAAHRDAAVCCAEPPCCMVIEYRNGVFSQTGRAAHAGTADRGTCQSPVLAQECGQVAVDVCLSELLRQLIGKQHCLSNFQAIIINTAVCILCDAQFLRKQFNTFPEFGNGCNSLVQSVFGHGVFGVKGNNDRGVRIFLSAPSPFKERE